MAVYALETDLSHAFAGQAADLLRCNTPYLGTLLDSLIYMTLHIPYKDCTNICTIFSSLSRALRTKTTNGLCELSTLNSLPRTNIRPHQHV